MGEKLTEIAGKARTLGIHETIGSLYGFSLSVKSETTQKDGFDMVQNRFYVQGEGKIYYHYNNGVLAADPKTAVRNFLNALTSMPPKLLEKYKSENEKISKDIPGLQEVLKDTWKREDELKALKNELTALEHRIEASLKSEAPGHETREISQNDAVVAGLTGADIAGKDSVTGMNVHEQGKAVPMPDNLENLKNIMGDRPVVASTDKDNNTVDANSNQAIRKNRGFRL